MATSSGKSFLRNLPSRQNFENASSIVAEASERVGDEKKFERYICLTNSEPKCQITTDNGNILIRSLEAIERKKRQELISVCAAEQ